MLQQFVKMVARLEKISPFINSKCVIRWGFTSFASMPSLKSIAAELGISYSLVSKVLSGRMGSTGVSDTTREAILKNAQEVHYQPNQLAVALKRGKKGAIGVFLHGMGVPGSDLSQAFLFGLSQALEKQSSRLWLRFFVTDEEFLEACDERLKRDVDGLIVGGVDHPGLTERLRQIDLSGLPVVSSFCGPEKQLHSANVSVDYGAQCYLPTKHLLEQGCRQIAHLRTVEIRHEGFVRAHREAGVPVNPSLIASLGSTSAFFVEDGEKSVRTLLERGVRFDGLAAESDAQARGAVKVLLESGLRVPEDVKVTGVDNSPLAEACIVPLTSATAEMEECGRVAIEMLNMKIDRQPVNSVTIPPKLVIRASSLPPTQKRTIKPKQTHS